MSVGALAAELERAAGGRVERDRPLAPLTTYRLGGRAALLVEPAGPPDLERVAAAVADSGAPVLALGRGSNVVVSDHGWPGVVVRLGPAFEWIRPEGGSGLAAGAGTSLPKLANFAARRALTGLEFCVAIPGSVGGAVRMNAGAHGRDVAAVLASASILEVSSAARSERGAADLGLAYRTSGLGAGDVVVEARFRLAPEDPAAIRDRMEEYRRHRAETQPGALQNAGSVFKNPPGDHAGRLVDACGLKGFSVGGASVSDLHANFFVARTGASAQNVHDLVYEVARRVRDRFGIFLEPEIRFAGRFESRSEVGR